jgi:hypothetical protein
MDADNKEKPARDRDECVHAHGRRQHNLWSHARLVRRERDQAVFRECREEEPALVGSACMYRLTARVERRPPGCCRCRSVDELGDRVHGLGERMRLDRVVSDRAKRVRVVRSHHVELVVEITYVERKEPEDQEQTPHHAEPRAANLVRWRELHHRHRRLDLQS